MRGLQLRIDFLTQDAIGEVNRAALSELGPGRGEDIGRLTKLLDPTVERTTSDATSAGLRRVTYASRTHRDQRASRTFHLDFNDASTK